MLSRNQLVPTVLALVTFIGLAGCKSKPVKTDFAHELAPGEVALEKITSVDYPVFIGEQNDAAALASAAQNSIDYLSKPSSKNYYPYLDITHDRALATAVAFKQLAAKFGSGGMSRAQLDQIVRSDFEVYRSKGAWEEEKGYTHTVLFTGYFTPTYEASLTRQGEFQYPLYKRPADLFTDPEGLTASRKTADGQYVLYYSRKEIEQGSILAGQELVWLKSRLDAYVISVQGSARLRLPDGRILEVGYAGNNGQPYVSPGKRLLADGQITKDQLNLKGLQAYFKANPGSMDKYLWINPRFVFFADRPGGPFGSLNTKVTGLATVATDKQVYPRGMPSYLTTSIPKSGSGDAPYFGWAMDQDAGGAIRAAGRADLYFGIGDTSEQMAGHMMYEGRFYYIAIKPEKISQYLSTRG